MRIISKFHDYYDPIMQYDQDKSFVYNRNETGEQIDGLTAFIPYSQYGFYLYQITIGFAGQIYPCIKVTFNHSGYNDVNINQHFYNANDIINFVRQKPPTRYYQKIHQSKWEDYRFDTFVVGVNKAFSNTNQYHQFFAFAPIFSIYHRSSNWNRSSIVYNTSLKKFSFEKILDPYTAYQNLRMYIEGMAQKPKPIPEIDDETMQSIKGFDHKYSFRKEPKR